ncbi:MAG TPA: glycosyltransferase [Solirubrobacteraceae bacterium]|jgi:glycosyltransferase involved in cell wall biosynthesis
MVSLGSTSGLRIADEELRGSLQRAGAEVALVTVPPPAQAPTLMLTDLGWSLSARRCLRNELARMREHAPRATIYSSTTAALLWPAPGAVRFDAPSAGNRRGRHGLWQRPLERRRLRRATLLLPWSEGAVGESPRGARRPGDTLVLPVPVEPSGPPRVRDIAAITYAANPTKKGLDRVLAAWRGARREGEELLVTGAGEEQLRRAGLLAGAEQGVRVTGPLAPTDYRELLRRARVFVCAPRREDYGIAQLEALVDGCLLVSTPAPGPYAALPIARTLDSRLIADDLAGALRVALDEPRPGYAERALEALTPFRRASCDRLVAEEVLPRLLA